MREDRKTYSRTKYFKKDCQIQSTITRQVPKLTTAFANMEALRGLTEAVLMEWAFQSPHRETKENNLMLGVEKKSEQSFLENTM